MRSIVFIAITIFAMLEASAWSTKGHQAIAYIARQHLTPATAEAVYDILDGNSMVYYASWMDQVVGTNEYSYTSTWHYFNVDPGETYDNRASLSGVDAITALHKVTATLGDPAATDADREFALKVIIHVIGDIHQPLHAGHGIDAGGNTIKVYFLDRYTNLHSVWDYNMVESAHSWSYYQWQQHLDVLTDEAAAPIIAGTLDDWARECVTVAGWIYAAFPSGCHINTTDIEEWTPVVEDQILKGGLRLAAYLNAIFDENASVDSPVSDNEDIQTPVYDMQGIEVSYPVRSPGIYITGSRHKIMVK